MPPSPAWLARGGHKAVITVRQATHKTRGGSVASCTTERKSNRSRLRCHRQLRTLLGRLGAPGTGRPSPPAAAPPAAASARLQRPRRWHHRRRRRRGRAAARSSPARSCHLRGGAPSRRSRGSPERRGSTRARPRGTLRAGGGGGRGRSVQWGKQRGVSQAAAALWTTERRGERYFPHAWTAR